MQQILTQDGATYLFALDHFGIVATPLISKLIRQDGDKRKRKTALNDLVKIARLTGQLPKEPKVQGAGLHVDTAGQLHLFIRIEIARPS